MAGQCAESKSAGDGGVRPIDQQPDLGFRTGEHAAQREGRGTAQGLSGNATQLVAIDRAVLTKRIGKLAPKRLHQILTSIDVVLGR